MKTILTPVDFSPSTAHVIDAALVLTAGEASRIILFHVVQPPIVTSDYGLAMENVQEILAVSEKAGARQLNHLAARLKAKGASVQVVQTTGSSVSQIVDHAAKLDADYIVMGSHGHTALYDLLVGSTTHGVLKKAPCPVLIVPPAPEKKGSKKRR